MGLKYHKAGNTIANLRLGGDGNLLFTRSIPRKQTRFAATYNKRQVENVQYNANKNSRFFLIYQMKRLFSSRL